MILSCKLLFNLTYFFIIACLFVLHDICLMTCLFVTFDVDILQMSDSFFIFIHDIGVLYLFDNLLIYVI